MAAWMETHRAVVFPWHCDHIGHMNVRWYAHFFDDAGFHLWTRIGLTPAELKRRGIVTVIASAKTDFQHELNAGDLLIIDSAFTRLGNSSLNHFQRMRNAETGVLSATQETVEVFFDLTTRKAVSMPDDIRKMLAAALVTEI